jgi:hypothetical protein
MPNGAFGLLHNGAAERERRCNPHHAGPGAFPAGSRIRHRPAPLPGGHRDAKAQSASCVTGKVETLRFFVFQSRFARPHDPLYRDLL